MSCGQKMNWKEQAGSQDGIAGRCRGAYDEDDDMMYILYFKDRAVFSLNATGAFSDGIIRVAT